MNKMAIETLTTGEFNEDGKGLPAFKKASDRGVLKATSPTGRGPPTEWWRESRA